MAIIVNTNQNAATEINGVRFIPKNGAMVSADNVTGEALALLKSIPGFSVLEGTDADDDPARSAALSSASLTVAVADAQEAEQRAQAAEQRARDADQRAQNAEQRASDAEASAAAALEAKAVAEAALAEAVASAGSAKAAKK